jgi:hypothetical protein
MGIKNKYMTDINLTEEITLSDISKILEIKNILLLKSE